MDCSLPEAEIPQIVLILPSDNERSGQTLLVNCGRGCELSHSDTAGCPYNNKSIRWCNVKSFISRVDCCCMPQFASLALMALIK